MVEVVAVAEVAATVVVLLVHSSVSRGVVSKRWRMALVASALVCGVAFVANVAISLESVLGAALLSGRVKVEDDGQWISARAPVNANPEGLGVLTVVVPSGSGPASRSGIVESLEALATVAGVVLPTTARGAQALDEAHRRREWTVTPEVQWAQLPGGPCGPTVSTSPRRSSPTGTCAAMPTTGPPATARSPPRS